VRVGHRALTSFLCSMAHGPGFDRTDTLLAVTTACSDIAGLELYLPLVTGSQVHLAAAETAADGFALRDAAAAPAPATGPESRVSRRAQRAAARRTAS
jgi:polyketide synthase PksN